MNPNITLSVKEEMNKVFSYRKKEIILREGDCKGCVFDINKNGGRDCHIPRHLPDCVYNFPIDSRLHYEFK